MRFDPFKWTEVKPNVETESPKGVLHVMCSEFAKVYVTCQGVEALAGVGHDVRVQIADAFDFKVETEKTARVFVENPRNVSFEPVGEIFTNADRRPAESGAMLEVTRGLREMKLLQKSVRNEMRALERSRKQVPQDDPAPDNEDVPDPADIPISDQETPAPDVPKPAKPKPKKDDDDA